MNLQQSVIFYQNYSKIQGPKLHENISTENT